MTQNKFIFITGGTSALGKAFVLRARAEGAKVFFTYNSNTAVAHELENRGAYGFHCDFTNPQEINSLCAVLLKTIPALDIVINNAAIVRDHIIANMTEEEWDSVIAVNIRSAITLSYALFPLLCKGQGKKLINIVSRVGLIGGFGQANYSAAKDALIEFTKVLAAEWQEEGICVNALNPGFMDSAMTRSIPLEAKKHHIKKSLLKTASAPDETAQFLWYLCSDGCKRLSGQIIHYDTRISHHEFL